MPTDVVMPQMGESIFEGTITKWLKKPGEEVRRDEPLFEISTDKVDAEIPAPASGVLKEIKVNEGATVQVNTVVGVIDADGGVARASGPSARLEEPGHTAPAAPPQPAATAGKTTGGAAATDGGASAKPAAPAPAAAASQPPTPPAGGGPATDVVMPQMGESIFEGTITKWLKKPGERVERDQPLFEISTDKVDAEIPAPVSGVLRDIKVEAGQTVQVNTVVATIGGEGAGAAPAQPAAKPAAAAPPVAAQPPQPSVARASGPSARLEEPGHTEERLRSSPLVRKMAKDNQVDLSQVPGTGLGGRITKQDMEQFLAGGAQRPAQAAPSAPATAARPAAPAPAPLPGEVVPMTPMRKKIAERMVESKRTSAHVHSVYEVDMTRVSAIREREKKSFEQRNNTRLTFTTFFCRAAVNALRKFPIINASVEGDSIRYHRNVNLGIAVALDWGLIVPIIKNAEEKNFLGVQRAMLDLADRARLKKLNPDDVQGGTFTITNPGQFGQMFGLPIILQPQVAIMGIGSIKKQPVVVTDKNGMDSIAIRSICHISLGYDHRVIDGAVADQFLREVAQYLENWDEELG
ncbi:MAG TPA: 2-oxoglutarate dehydrogenase, E2 component, dihydrolipoamide succinyltransferase [Terriglobales bacterium]|nr:2-oxoglutarate dehydrogenase, E2 component, dihydrolipoamide succinyltransferase [Terriglobales bacterium]